MMFHVELAATMNRKYSKLKVKDHLVSGEQFQLRYNPQLEMLETYPQPDKEQLQNYYKSENYSSHIEKVRTALDRVYNIVRGISINKKLFLINKYRKGMRGVLLDFGCGTGSFLTKAKAKGWDVVGIEPNKSARIIANKKTDNAVYPLKELKKFSQSSFDVITLWHVLEHIPEPKKLLVRLKSILNNNGILVIAAPNFNSFDAKHYEEFWAAFDVPRHLWHFSRESIVRIITSLNMQVVNCCPLKYDAYYVSLLSEKYKHGKMRILKSLWIGWLSNLKAMRSKEYSSLIYIIRKYENSK